MNNKEVSKYSSQKKTRQQKLQINFRKDFRSNNPLH